MSNDLGSEIKKLSVVDWLLIVFCGPISCILGIIALTKGETMRGVLLIVMPIVIGVVINVIMMVLGVGAGIAGGAAGP